MPVQSAHAVAASTFSTLCWPRSVISVTGQIALGAAVELGHDPAVVDEDAVGQGGEPAEPDHPARARARRARR